MRVDSLLPRRVHERGPSQVHAGLCLVASMMVCAVALGLVALVYLYRGEPARVGVLVGGLGAVVGVYAVLARTGSVPLASCLFLAGAIVLAALPQTGMIGFAIPTAFAYITTKILGPRAGLSWSVLATGWVLFAMPNLGHLPAYPVDVGYALALLTLGLGVAAAWSEVVQGRYAQARKAEAANLTSQRERVQKVVQSLFPGVVEVEGNTITYASGGIPELVGYAPEALIGRDLLSYIHPDDLANVRAWIDQDLQHPLELRVRHHDGHWVWISGFGFAFGETDTCGRWTVALRDASLERDERETLIQRQRLEGVGVLAAGVAHDFKNLLTVIGGVAELMERSQARGTIMEAVNDASDLVNKLVEIGQGGEDSQGTDLIQALGSMRFVLRSHLGAGIEMYMDLPPASAWVGLSQGQLNQVVLNLVTNAKEAMGDRGRLAITVDGVPVDEGETLAAGDYWRLVVVDDGRGMDDDMRARAFEPYISSKPDRPGTGLGLASVYGIVRQAGGSVELHSVPGEGCRVVVLLPRAAAAASVVQPSAIAPRRSAGDGTILVVEDEEIIADLIARNLVKAGYSVTIKNDLESAWAHLELGLPDILITDIMMPDGRGTDLARRLRDNAVEIPILFISGYADEEISDWRRAGGEISFLAKPFLGQELVDRVASLVAARRNGEASRV